jgi:hypothetical protein
MITIIEDGVLVVARSCPANPRPEAILAPRTVTICGVAG